VAIVETRLSVWEALAGRAPGQPVGPADPGLWAAVVERLNPARAKPHLRAGIEMAELTSVRGVPYAMLKSPDDGGRACYLRLTPEEVRLARLMDGTRTVARLVAEFVRICGRLAPDQVTRVVADLAGNRMLDELPVDAFRPLDRVHRRPWPVRLGRGLLAAARGQRMVVANVDPIVGFLYRAGGRVLFTRPALGLASVVAFVGLALFVWMWWLGDPSVFLTNGSYAVGALVLLGLNVFALACHELGHALAAKHAKRRVPAAGFLVYFGIPSVFVDTTDVWMAGRRARLLTTAAGPGTGLVLAGLAQIVGFIFPELSPWTFKLSFAWYINALFNLNPFLALDGYYLLMDWLEVPNLRARGLSWVTARLRRRPPRWGQLDREGRLVALYGVLAVVWLVIAANIAYRVYADRVSGLITGLWRSGWSGRLLIVAVIAGLSAPIVYAVSGWLLSRWRSVRRGFATRRVSADLPRRLDALRTSSLGHLPVPVLSSLAGSASWVRPRTGSQIVFAGTAQPSVFVVVDGALEGRRPGDPSGFVRQRVGPGGVVGLAGALTGAPSSLAWHTAGTTLLAVPSTSVAAAVLPSVGSLGERAEVEELLGHTPALAALSEEDRLALASRAVLHPVAPGAPVMLPGAEDALVIASGVLVLPDGTDLRRGTLIGPVGEVLPGPVATARTPARVWILPAVSGLPSPSSAVAGRRPSAGVHPMASYPPLAAPPGPPPPNVDDSTDRRFERKLWWLLILLLAFALFLTGTNFIAGPVWAEMRADQALLRVDRGTVFAVVNGSHLELNRGDEVYVSEGDSIDVWTRSRGTLVYRGGGTSVLCAGSTLSVGPLMSTVDGRLNVPSGALSLVDGLVVSSTGGTSRAFAPLSLSVASAGHVVANTGEAWYAVGSGTDVSFGVVSVDGVPQRETGSELSCGDGVPVPRPVDPTPTATGEPSPSDSPSPTPSPSAAPSESASPSPSLSTSPTRTRTTRPPTTRPPTTAPPTTGPPSNLPPKITNLNQGGSQITQLIRNQVPCNTGVPTTIPISVVVTDDRTPAQLLRVEVRWSGFAQGSNRMNWDGPFFGSIGPVPFSQPNAGGTLKITVIAFDAEGLSSSIDGKPVTVLPCDLA